MSKETAIEMFVGGLVLDRNTQAPVVILKDERGEFSLPIWIGIAEATSIASAINQLTMARPLTHDLMHTVFTELGVSVQRVLITDLRDSTYFAELVLSQGDKALIVDARPSDAIAIALRASAPIFVAQKVLDQAQNAAAHINPQPETGEKGDESAEEGGSGEGGDPKSAGPKSDFTNIDKEKWEEILAELDPDDFKYET